MPRLLVVHHTVSPPLEVLLHAAAEGASQPGLEEVEVVVRPALVANAIDVLEADGYLLGIPANLGSMSGALKHFFDTVYYPCAGATQRRPWPMERACACSTGVPVIPASPCWPAGTGRTARPAAR